MGAERRENPRFACDVDVVMERQDGSSCHARTVDISFSGICVLAEEGFRSGSRVNFGLKLVWQGGETDTLVLPGQVVWSTPTRGSHQVGARFLADDMNDRVWQQLDVFLQFLAGELKLPDA